MPAEFVFVSPANLMPSTIYHLEVRARVDGGTELRTGRLNTELAVA